MAAVFESQNLTPSQRPDNFDATGDPRYSEPVVDSMASSSSMPLPSLRSAPLPNPPFVFPARPASSAPSRLNRPGGRRPQSSIEPRTPTLVFEENDDSCNSSSPALPAFSFNPGASLPPTPTEGTFLSPLQSPTAPASPLAIPAWSMGVAHRRGGSEFVGGSLRGGDSLLGSSPAKSDSGMPSPLLPPNRGPPRRGHAHRRSAAISSHDLSSIILPPSSQKLRGGSAPNSPALANKEKTPEFSGAAPSPTLTEPVTSPSSDDSVDRDSDPVALDVDPAHASKPTPRTRVGFSDTLEYIPRPLSLVSSDTSSTVTARPGHSVSGSISSLISLNTGERELIPTLELTASAKADEDRPSTAGAILEPSQSSQVPAQILQSPRRRGSIPLLGEIPPISPAEAGTPSPTRAAKKWLLFSRESSIGGSPTRSHSSELAREQYPAELSQITGHPSAGESGTNSCSDFKVGGKKKSKKQKKIKSWAILPRKSKSHYGKQKRRAPTPPLRDSRSHERNASNATATEPSGSHGSSMPTVLVTDSSGSGEDESWNYPGAGLQPGDEDTTYPMIDLDAALGPFNTPIPQLPLVKKQLHSAAGRTRFAGPGMHYHHRRAESAPEMVPFDTGRFGFPRFGSSSTMADVFEEDEEEDRDDRSLKSTGNSASSVGTPVVEVSGAEDSSIHGDAAPSGLPRHSSESARAHSIIIVSAADQQTGNRLTTDHASTDSPASLSPIQDETVAEPAGRRSLNSLRRRYSNSPNTSPAFALRPREMPGVELSQLDLPGSSLAPASPYSMTQSSSFPSPRSPVSYDAHRISTAPSSITEDNFESLLRGEPGPELRISVDDIPSLTSSNSTITRESVAHGGNARHPPLSHEQPRPASFTSTAFGRRRSSLASLHRLISSSHGERSKLSMEVPMDSEPEKKHKVSKAKRIGRMVQFWKSKDAESA